MSNPIDWSKQPRKYQEFAGKLGLGPLYEPKPEAKRKCPKCGPMAGPRPKYKKGASAYDLGAISRSRS